MTSTWRFRLDTAWNLLVHEETAEDFRLPVRLAEMWPAAAVELVGVSGGGLGGSHSSSEELSWTGTGSDNEKMDPTGSKILYK